MYKACVAGSACFSPATLLCSGALTTGRWRHLFICSLTQGNAWANFVKWSVMTNTLTDLCLLSWALQKSMHTSSMGASKGARAAGWGVFARIQRWQHFTYSLMSLPICGQKKHCRARCAVLACPWCPAKSCTPARALAFKLTGSTNWYLFSPLNGSLVTLYRTPSWTFRWCHCLHRVWPAEANLLLPRLGGGSPLWTSGRTSLIIWSASWLCLSSLMEKAGSASCSEGTALGRALKNWVALISAPFPTLYELHKQISHVMVLDCQPACPERCPWSLCSLHRLPEDTGLCTGRDPGLSLPLFPLLLPKTFIRLTDQPVAHWRGKSIST